MAQDVAKAGTTGSAASSKSERRAFLLWNRMRQAFGTRFLEQFGIEPNDLWIRAVESLTDAQIKLGLERMVKAGTSHPPTLPEFVALATKPEPVRSTYTPTASIDGWQRAANAVFSRRLRASLAHGRPMVPPSRANDMVDGLRSLKAEFAADYGHNPEPAVVEAFQNEVERMLDGLQDA